MDLRAEFYKVTVQNFLDKAIINIIWLKMMLQLMKKKFKNKSHLKALKIIKN